MKSINPANGETIASYKAATPHAVDTCIATAEATFQSWRRSSFADRSQALVRIALALEKTKDELACIITSEMGKPLAQSEAEIEKCAWVCRYYAENGARFLAPEEAESEAQESFISFEPLGVILAVMPWNFPFWQLFRFAAPAIMAGNTILLKHASNVSGCALAIQDVFQRAGLPNGALQSLLMPADGLQQILDDPRVMAATLTGSGLAGSSLAAMAGTRIKKTVLELGGSDAYLIMEDADLEDAAKKCAASRLNNAGQSCISAKRFVAVDAIRDRFTELLAKEMQSYEMGDPMERPTKIGPLAREDLRDDLHRQVNDSVSAGSRLIIGGEFPSGEGYYYPPTVLADVCPGSPAYEEELFGPVAAIIPARDESEAIRIANDTRFGLGGGVFTQNIQRGKRIARLDLEAGCCFVNSCVASDPRLPFGGIKESGYGRELSRYGILEFVNIKTVSIG